MIRFPRRLAALEGTHAFRRRTVGGTSRMHPQGHGGPGRGLFPAGLRDGGKVRQTIRQSFGADRRRGLALGEHSIHGRGRDEIVPFPYPLGFHLSGPHSQQQAGQSHAAQLGGFGWGVEPVQRRRGRRGRGWARGDGFHDAAAMRRRDTAVGVQGGRDDFGSTRQRCGGWFFFHAPLFTT